MIKWASRDYPTGQIVFFRNFLAFVPVLLFFWRGGSTMSLRTRYVGGHLLRGHRRRRLDVLLLPGARPAAARRRHRARHVRADLPDRPLGAAPGRARGHPPLVGGARGFRGVLIMVRPGSGVFESKALIPLAGAFFYAVAMVSIRRLAPLRAGRHHRLLLHAVAAAVVRAACQPALAMGRRRRPARADDPHRHRPPRRHRPADADLCLQAGAGRRHRAVRISALLFGAVFGYAIWSEVPDRYVLLGAAIVVASGLYILYRETVRRRQSV